MLKQDFERRLRCVFLRFSVRSGFGVPEVCPLSEILMLAASIMLCQINKSDTTDGGNVPEQGAVCTQ